jgi:hypothetical protein
MFAAFLCRNAMQHFGCNNSVELNTKSPYALSDEMLANGRRFADSHMPLGRQEPGGGGLRRWERLSGHLRSIKGADKNEFKIIVVEENL